MLEDFIAGLGAGDYAANRVRGLADWGQSESPMSYNALLVAYDRPPDPFRLPGATPITGAEMVVLAGLGADPRACRSWPSPARR